MKKKKQIKIVGIVLTIILFLSIIGSIGFFYLMFNQDPPRWYMFPMLGLSVVVGVSYTALKEIVELNK